MLSKMDRSFSWLCPFLPFYVLYFSLFDSVSGHLTASVLYPTSLSLSSVSVAWSPCAEHGQISKVGAAHQPRPGTWEFGRHAVSSWLLRDVEVSSHITFPD